MIFSIRIVRYTRIPKDLFREDVSDGSIERFEEEGSHNSSNTTKAVDSDLDSTYEKELA